MTENNYKFKLESLAPKIKQWLLDHPHVVLPETRYNELLGSLGTTMEKRRKKKEKEKGKEEEKEKEKKEEDQDEKVTIM